MSLAKSFMPVNRYRRLVGSIVVGLLTLSSATTALCSIRSNWDALLFPPPLRAESRLITIDDLAKIRDIDHLAVSPDGRRFAILVRQADPPNNTYHTAWFVGTVGVPKLRFLGDAGDARLITYPGGSKNGELSGGVGRWSPDGRHFAFIKKSRGQVQVWVSDLNGRLPRQLTHNAADVREFAWASDGSSIMYEVGKSRAANIRLDNAEARNGIQLEEFLDVRDIIHDGRPSRSLETNLAVWIVAYSQGFERPTSRSERREFAKLASRDYSTLSGGTEMRRDLSSLEVPAVRNPNGGIAWLIRDSHVDKGYLPRARLTASLHRDGSDPIACRAAQCVGQQFKGLWWSPSGKRIIFLRVGDDGFEQGLFAWTPGSQYVSRVSDLGEDQLSDCSQANGQLICLRETLTRPKHVVTINLITGNIREIADVNPEFRAFRFGKVERIDWNAPADTAHLGYPATGHGYVIYPPDFKPGYRYPVIIAPYKATGFQRGDIGDEQPLLVYAAHGFVVLHTSFPVAWGSLARDSGYLFKWYSPEQNFPHITMLLESTLAGLDALESKGFVDEQRVGMGGLSQGAMITLAALQHHDRLAAASVAQTGWEPSVYYFETATGRKFYRDLWLGNGAFPPDPDSTIGELTYSGLDIANHVDQIEAPVLLQVADRESFSVLRLIRKLDDTGLPYDAYIFPDEYHIKWQPSHRLAVYRRNLDWFRFWLQGYEDPNPAKREQYAHWEHLCELQRTAHPRAAFCVPH